MEVAWLAGKNRYELPQKNNVSLAGPTQEDIEASSEMTSEERQDMIAGMVEGLANRLESEGGTSEEWARLIRALSVLGEIKRAQKVWLESQKIFSSSPNDLKIINNTATEVGISE
jgi:cytochrome c-type biogenesis protein CcmH